MASFEKGVSFYTKGTASVVVAFPENDVICRWCRFLRSDKDNARHYCRLTDDIIYNIETIGDCCPIRFEK